MKGNDEMQIKAPFGYRDVTPVLKTHRIARDTGSVPETLRTTQVVPVSFAEMPLVARDYPIVFVKPAGAKVPRILALLGLRPGQNLYVNADGAWREDVYQPAYVRRYPFCMAAVHSNGSATGELIVCVESEMIDEAGGEPVADAEGGDTPWWREVSHFLKEYEADMLRTEKVCDLMEKNGLLEPFSAQAVSNASEVTNLTGMLRVSEAKLGRLKSDTLRMLINKGVMGRLYAHMMSLDRFGRLLDMQHHNPA